MPRPLATLTLAVLALLATPSAAEVAISDRFLKPEIERFHLFNACRPMGLRISHRLESMLTAIAPFLGSLQAAAKNRLRAVGLYSRDLAKTGGASLYVYINAAGDGAGGDVTITAYNISVSYRKVVFDEFGNPGSAATRVTGITGTPGKDADYMVSSLSQLLDEFLAAYLLVNEEACEAK